MKIKYDNRVRLVNDSEISVHLNEFWVSQYNSRVTIYIRKGKETICKIEDKNDQLDLFKDTDKDFYSKLQFLVELVLKEITEKDFFDADKFNIFEKYISIMRGSGSSVYQNFLYITKCANDYLKKEEQKNLKKKSKKGVKNARIPKKSKRSQNK